MVSRDLEVNISLRGGREGRVHFFLLTTDPNHKAWFRITFGSLFPKDDHCTLTRDFHFSPNPRPHSKLHLRCVRSRFKCWRVMPLPSSPVGTTSPPVREKWEKLFSFTLFLIRVVREAKISVLMCALSSRLLRVIVWHMKEHIKSAALMKHLGLSLDNLPLRKCVQSSVFLLKIRMKRSIQKYSFYISTCWKVLMCKGYFSPRFYKSINFSFFDYFFWTLRQPNPSLSLESCSPEGKKPKESKN